MLDSEGERRREEKEGERREERDGEMPNMSNMA
jgi:hypothetical protein